MEIIDYMYQHYGLKGVESVLNKTVFQGIKQYLTRGDTKGFDWLEFRELFTEDLYDIDRMALAFSQKLSEFEYSSYLSELNTTSVMKRPLQFIKLRLKDLELTFNFGNRISKIRKEQYIVSPIAANSEIRVNEFLEMHYYQLWVKNQVNKKLQSGIKRLIIHLPTGSGKTRTANELLCERLNSALEGSVIIWVCHSVELCSQAETSMIRLLKYRAQRSVNVIPFFGNSKEFVLDETRPNLVYMTYGKLNSYRKKNGIKSLANRTKLVVVDEAHKVLATTYSESITSLISMGSELIGLTATPGRGNADNQVMNKALSAFFFTNLISYKEVNAGNLFEILTEQGYLARIEHEILFHSGSFRLNNEDLLSFNKTGFLPGEAIEDLSSNFSRNDEIIGRISQLIREGKQRILVFAASTEHAKILLALMKFRNIKSSLVLGETQTENRQETYDLFKKGDINVIVNFGVLTTGFDEPKLDVCIIARPCSSPVLYSQMVGRALRGKKNGGNLENRIIDVSDNFIGMPELDQLFVRWNLNF